MQKISTSQIDLYENEIILDPYPTYGALREAGPVVYLERHNIYAVARYEDVRDAARDHKVFSSASGVGVDDVAARRAVGTLIASDPPDHDRLRKIMMVPLSPSSVAALRTQIGDAADEIVKHLIEREDFDVVADLAQALPLSIVSHMVGLPGKGRENMLRWAAATFDLLGPANERAAKALPHVDEMRAYATAVANRESVVAGGWADRILDLAEAGEIEHSRVPSLFRDFMAPALDTTILATASTFWCLGQNPDQWRSLVEDPSLIRGAINEAIRLESPIRGFTRVTTQDAAVGGSIIPQGARVLLLFASANRDETKWEEPSRYDIRRKNADHLGFGFGVHSCAGMHLARLEIECLLSAFVKYVSRFSVFDARWTLNNTLRGLVSLRARVEAR